MSMLRDMFEWVGEVLVGPAPITWETAQHLKQYARECELHRINWVGMSEDDAQELLMYMRRHYGDR